MSYRIEPTKEGSDIVIDGFEKGIASSPYTGIANMRNVGISYMPSVAYVNYKRQSATLNQGSAYTISVDSANIGTVSGDNSSLQTSLNAYYKLDDTSDSTANANTLTNNNSVTFDTGFIGNGADFGTSNTNKYLSRTSTLGMSLNSDFSFSCWVKMNTEIGSGEQGFVFMEDATHGNDILLAYQYNGGTRRLLLNRNQIGTGSVSGLYTLTMGTTNWYHFVIQYTAGTGVCNLYVNGVLATTLTQTGAGSGGTSNFTLGCEKYSNSTSNFASCKIDEVGAWQKALTTGEISSLYNSGSGQQYPFTTGLLSLSYSHTCSSGNRYLIAAVQLADGDTVSSITYGGNSLTQIGTNVQGSTANQVIALYGLVNPASGTNTVSITRTDTTAVSFGICSVSFYNVNQSSPVNVNNTNTGTTNVTNTLTTAVANCFGFSFSASAATISAGTGSTLLERLNNSNSFGLFTYSSNPIVSPGAFSMTSGTSSGGSQVGQIMIGLAPIVSTPMANPVAKATSPAGLNYVLDANGQVWKQSSVNSSTFNYLQNGTGRIGNGAGGLAYWNNYLFVFGNGYIETCGNGTGDPAVTSANWNVGSSQNTISVTYTTNYAAYNHYIFPAQTVPSLPNFQLGTPVTFSSTGTLSAPLVAGTVYYISDVDSSNNIFEVTTTYADAISESPSNTITLTGDGSGTQTMTTNIAVSLPIGNVSTVSLSWVAGTETATITSYTNPNGTAAPDGLWQLPTGVYNITDTNGNNLIALFTYNTPAVTFLNPTVFAGTASSIQLLSTSVSSYKTLISKVDGNLYFSNGRWMGTIASSPDINFLYNPSINSSYSVNYAITGTLQPQDSIVDMIDLRGSMMILGNYDAYPWDYVSAQPSASFPIGEQNRWIINILNNLYIGAGQKGNIYVSNGSAAQLLFKIPDYISGVIDPVWTFGDKMFHRGKLYLQALAQDTSGNYLLAGVFSLNVSATLVTDVETSGAFNMEAQNSYGLIPTSGTTGAGLLIDNEPSSSGQDSYYSAYSTGSGTGGIDYNSTLLWGSNEPVIETEIIPIGNYLVKKTLGSIEFKLDRPLATGDSISLYWRPSLSASWTSIPTIDTSSGLLSNYAISAINQSQWAQFKITYSAASSSSSFIPLRELRLHLTP